ncbi:MAG TPA: UDP-3-O-acyl-N-acetylglucosamine deacetylase [Thermodesulfobacteriota bacterium]|nr:UDP-3-O-acyl-N-acetylglucosamine deacetylase [Thermodesulfobacteriota bacterium]
MDRQTTLARPVTCRGVGLHSGQPVRLALLPAGPGTGIVFVRTDLPGRPALPARVSSVIGTTLATTLGRDGVRVGTVEHLLAALYGLGIDNCVVEVSGPEVPIMDGSAAPFVALLESAGCARLDAPRLALVVDRPVELARGEQRIRVEPAGRLELVYEIAYDHPAVPPQRLAMPLDPARFAAELAPARTFGFLAEVEALKRRGLARGGSLENAVVVGADRVLNPGGLRFADEFVRHKALDLVGDLALLTVPLVGRVTVSRGGHRLHTDLVAALLADPSAWHLAADPSLDGAAGPQGRPAAVAGLAAPLPLDARP